MSVMNGKVVVDTEVVWEFAVMMMMMIVTMMLVTMMLLLALRRMN